LNPATATVKYAIYHDITVATDVQLFDGPPGTNNSGSVSFVDADPTTAITPILGVFTISRQQWIALYSGNVYVSIDSEFSTNQICGAITCISTSCTPAPAISTANPCTVAGSVPPLYIYNDSLVYPFNDGSWSSNSDNVTTIRQFNSTTYLCGNASIHLGIREGALSLDIWNPKLYLTIDSRQYQYFEFFVKILPGFNSTTLGANFGDGSGNNILSFPITNLYIDNLVVDNTIWSRVRIPLADCGFAQVQTVSRFTLYQYNWNVPYVEMWIDNIRFVPAVTETYTPGLTMNEIVANSQLACEADHSDYTMPPEPNLTWVYIVAPIFFLLMVGTGVGIFFFLKKKGMVETV
jgi:hypothetical protein